MPGNYDMNDSAFTPALGRPELTDSYDRTIRFWTRENVWRTALLDQVAPNNGETILDVGCGTSTFAIMLKRAAPHARVVGLDPDPQILEIAAAKAKRCGARVEWQQGFARDAASFVGSIDKVVSSLVFHQVPLVEKRAGLAAMLTALRPGGDLHVADYARQGSSLMRFLFRHTVQRIDGVTDTQPNADGALETILEELSGSAVRARRIVPTMTGAIRVSRSGCLRAAVLGANDGVVFNANLIVLRARRVMRLS